jgi:glutamate synthase domain-containing protein 1
MEYYQDLEDADFESHCAMVHSRYVASRGTPAQDIQDFH